MTVLITIAVLLFGFAPAQAATPTAEVEYPTPIAELVEQDSTTECDEIGWNSIYYEGRPEEQDLFDAVCTESGVYFGAGCAQVSQERMDRVLGPDNKSMFLSCGMQVVNDTSRSLTVFRSDFSIVSLTDRMFRPTLEGLPADSWFFGETIPAGRNVIFGLVFKVPRDSELPLRLEIRSDLIGDEDLDGVFIIHKLNKTN